ncbi:hypothetical protein T439DRAFT_321373 [Meredithblackwellia eburnea MCA 4105]
MVQTEIICGVTCDCAPKANECSAHDSCAMAAGGKCSCAGGVCLAGKCDEGVKGACSCAPGTCAKVEAYSACAEKGSCDCKEGNCVKAAVSK